MMHDLMIVLKPRLDGSWEALGYDGEKRVAELQTRCVDPGEAANVMAGALAKYLEHEHGLERIVADAQAEKPTLTIVK